MKLIPGTQSVRRVLVLSPHTDDAELGCGGTLARCLEAGVEVHVAAFSTAAESLPPGVPSDTLAREFQRAMETIGVPASHLTIRNYPVRRLSYHRQEVLEDLVRLRSSLQPDAVLLPATTDLHQDHQILSAEGIRAFKTTTILGYELPWNHIEFSPQAFSELEERHLNQKWSALLAYETQISLKRRYFDKSFIWSLATMRGVQVGAPYAEAFQVCRLRF